jgi:hypothetical protein
MYTLETIYSRLVSGALGEKRESGFVGPSLDPGSTGHSLNDIMKKLPFPDNSTAAGPEDVIEGKSFWGLNPNGGWGASTGTRSSKVLPKGFPGCTDAGWDIEAAVDQCEEDLENDPMGTTAGWCEHFGVIMEMHIDHYGYTCNP